MPEHQSDRVSAVLIVSKHEEFAAKASQQLADNDYTVWTQSPKEALKSPSCEGYSAVVALVDCDAKAADGSPFRHAIRATLPDSQIILVCTLDQASTGAQLVRSGEASDYVLTDSLQDPERLTLDVERASASLSADPVDAGAQYQQVLQALAGMRDLLKDGNKNPIARLLNGLKFNLSSSWFNGELLDQATADYEVCLPDFIAGRLRRLENQILLWGRDKLHVASRLTGSHILVVEDDTVSGELAQHILERHGFKVVVAQTAVDAKQALGKCPPDLVLMDIHLGDANGLELIKRLRAGTTCPNVPIIVATSDRMRDTLLDAVDVKVQGYLLKPYQPNLLVQKVKDALAKSKTEPADIAG